MSVEQAGLDAIARTLSLNAELARNNRTITPVIEKIIRPQLIKETAKQKGEGSKIKKD